MIDKADKGEETLVLQDGDGNYFLLPMKHMHLNAVSREHFKELDRRLGAGDAVRSDAMRAVGVYHLSPVTRREFVVPRVDQIVVIPSPPS
jgi:hypothetical protein